MNETTALVEELESLEAPGFWWGVAAGAGTVAAGTLIGVAIT
ncbi:daptide-type RiPP [Motilibacter aurantiacus]|nr:daptide-type RiPP [Motilibacter aurantiacus]